MLPDPLLLVSVYILFLASILVHGLLIWTNPLARILAVATSVIVVVMTLAVRKAFAQRTVVELCNEQGDEGERGFFSITTAGRPGVADVRLEYPRDEKHYEASAGEGPDFSSLRRASFRTEGGATILKV
ncbi:MAG: hypothetical protein ICV31_04135 [Rubrobacter sp.]|nr:hypothetical protein [Rubrobacter sp.]